MIYCIIYEYVYYKKIKALLKDNIHIFSLKPKNVYVFYTYLYFYMILYMYKNKNVDSSNVKTNFKISLYD